MKSNFNSDMKLQAPILKFQIGSKSQAPKTMGCREQNLRFGAWCFFGAWILVFGALLSAPAYPPAPDHEFYGTVRDEWGDPIDMSGARIYIQSSNGVGANAPVAVSTQPGINYRLLVPMDSARSVKICPMPLTRLRQEQPFQLKVQIGQISYLPIQMVIPYLIGEPAGLTRLDLTLGVDADGDGLPDAWEQALIDIYGGSLEDIGPDDDTDGDGIKNIDEYIAGTYAFDPADGFRLSIQEVVNKNSRLEMFVIRGRNYTLHSSYDLKQWTPVNFRVLANGTPGPIVSNYQSTEVQYLRVEVPFQIGAETNRYFRALVQ